MTLPGPILTTQLKPLFLLGDEIIDRDHRGLLAQFQAVIDSDNVAFPTLLRTLLVHIEQHFEREHELMAKYRYRGLRDHKAEHNLVLREFHRCIERVDCGLLPFGRTFVSERLVPWFELHVPSMDYTLSLHIQKQLATQRSR
jgi:hemerythrin-like metal-binding protein